MWKTTSDIVIVNEATLVDWKRHNERMFQNRNIVMTKQFGLRSFVADEIRSKYKSICTSSMFYVPSREHMELHHFRAQIPNSSFTCRSSIFFMFFFLLRTNKKCIAECYNIFYTQPSDTRSSILWAEMEAEAALIQIPTSMRFPISRWCPFR